MTRICVVGDDIQILGPLKLVLLRAVDEVREFNSGEQLPEVLQQTTPHVLLLDVGPEGMSEAELISAMRLSWAPVPSALMTGFGTPGAIRLGVIAYLQDADEDPYPRLNSEGEARRDAQTSPAIERWARIVVRGSMLTADPKTLDRWAHEIGISYGGLRNWCRAARIPSKVSLQFTRLLRAVMWSTKSERPLHDFLDVVDGRTLSSLLRRGGLNPVDSRTRPTSVERFLSTQDLVTNADALATVRCLLDAETLENGNDEA